MHEFNKNKIKHFIEDAYITAEQIQRTFFLLVSLQP